MNKKEKDFMSQLNDLDSFSVEEIAENYPALNENIKKRILKKCMKKEGLSTEIDYDDESIVWQIEHHNRSPWYKYVASAAVFVIAAVGITSVFMLNRNHKGNDYYYVGMPSAVYSTETNSNSDQATLTTSATQAQNTFFNTEGFYYVKASGEDEGLIMGFSFAPDGSLTKYVFDDYGDAINNTMEHTNYEVTENRFSYALPSGKARSGTIVNTNGTNSFSVQFDDGQLCNFSTERPIFKTQDNVPEKTFTLNGTTWGWYSDDHSVSINIEFNEDGVSGTYIVYPYDIETTETKKTPFTYEKNDDEYTLYLPDLGENIVFKARLLGSESIDPTLAIEYIGEGTIYFYLIDKGDNY